jgi:hypothetical protein
MERRNGSAHSHSGSELSSLTGTGEFILLHGNLSIKDNEKAVVFALESVFRSVDYPIIIAGQNPSQQLVNKIRKHPGVKLIVSPEDDVINRLIKDAHINILISFQQSGLKLKLINSLFRGRFVVANPPAVNGSGLEELVFTGKDHKELIRHINDLMKKEFDQSMIEKRKQCLENYTNRTNIKNLVRIIEF